MKTKKEIVDNWLPRYTGRGIKRFPQIYSIDEFRILPGFIFGAIQRADCRRQIKPCPTYHTEISS